MTKTKRSRILSLMSLLLLFTLISTCLMSGTLAKYISTSTGSDSARVAKWGFDGINTLDIFDNAYGTTVIAAGGASGDNVVAPGTSKAFTFGFASGLSEVTSKITFAISETNAGNIPIVYEFGGSYYSSVLSGTVYLKMPGASAFTAVTIAGNLAALSTAISATSAYAIIPPNTNYSTLTGGTITWYWAFEQDGTSTAGGDIATRDTADTALGLAATAATVQLDVALTAEQVD